MAEGEKTERLERLVDPAHKAVDQRRLHVPHGHADAAANMPFFARTRNL
jgi:hypothetical protein